MLEKKTTKKKTSHILSLQGNVNYKHTKIPSHSSQNDSFQGTTTTTGNVVGKGEPCSLLVQLLWRTAWMFPKESRTAPGPSYTAPSVWEIPREQHITETFMSTAAVFTVLTEELIKTRRELRWARKSSKGMGEAAREDVEGSETKCPMLSFRWVILIYTCLSTFIHVHTHMYKYTWKQKWGFWGRLGLTRGDLEKRVGR